MKKRLLIGATLAVVAASWLHHRSAQPPGPAVRAQNDRPDTATAGTRLRPDALSPLAAPANDDDGTEMVLGLRVRKDRNCTVELRDYVTPAGEMFSAYTCTPHAAPSPHPYATYTDASLEVMAYSDAEAAALLGKRLIERDTGRSYEMLIRAAALDNDFTHLTWLAEQAFGTLRVDGEPQLDNLKRQYELAAVAAYLGGSPGRARMFREELVSEGVDSGEIATLDARVGELLQQVRDIQRAVHGAATVGGPSDA